MEMNNKMSGSDEISILIYAILQPAMAGGMTEERSIEIYEEIMSNIARLGTLTNGRTAFDDLKDDILNKWAMRYIKPQNLVVN